MEEKVKKAMEELKEVIEIKENNDKQSEIIDKEIKVKVDEGFKYNNKMFAMDKESEKYQKLNAQKLENDKGIEELNQRKEELRLEWVKGIANIRNELNEDIKIEQSKMDSLDKKIEEIRTKIHENDSIRNWNIMYEDAEFEEEDTAKMVEELKPLLKEKEDMENQIQTTQMLTYLLNVDHIDKIDEIIKQRVLREEKKTEDKQPEIKKLEDKETQEKPEINETSAQKEHAEEARKMAKDVFTKKEVGYEDLLAEEYLYLKEDILGLADKNPEGLASIMNEISKMSLHDMFLKMLENAQKLGKEYNANHIAEDLKKIEDREKQLTELTQETKTAEAKTAEAKTAQAKKPEDKKVTKLSEKDVEVIEPPKVLTKDDLQGDKSKGTEVDKTKTEEKKPEEKKPTPFYIKIGRRASIIMGKSEINLGKYTVMDGLDLDEAGVIEILKDSGISLNNEKAIKEAIENKVIDSVVINGLSEFSKLEGYEAKAKEMMESYCKQCLHTVKEKKLAVTYDQKDLSKSGLFASIMQREINIADKNEIMERASVAERHEVGMREGTYKPNLRSRFMAFVTGQQIKTLPTIEQIQNTANVYNMARDNTKFKESLKVKTMTIEQEKEFDDLKEKIKESKELSKDEKEKLSQYRQVKEYRKKASEVKQKIEELDDGEYEEFTSLKKEQNKQNRERKDEGR